jgi:mono/diheme cytochrome c family protein
MGRICNLLASLPLLFAACIAPPDPVRGTPLSALEEEGWKIFSREPCFSACHVTSVTPSAPASATVFVPDLSRTSRRTRDWYLAYFVDPRAVLPHSPMPSFGYLPKDEIAALVAFLQRLNRDVPAPQIKLVSAAEIPLTPKNGAAYKAGGRLYETYCGGCHGESGNGGGRVGHLLSPEPRDFTDTVWMSKQTENYLFSVIGDGKPATAMPAFKDILTPEERALVFRYVEYFADPVARERMELGFVAPREDS